jgi:hypothetical protein
MKLWEMRREEGALIGYVPDEKLSVAITRCGIEPAAVRNALSVANANTVDMQLAKPSAATVQTERQVIPDVVFWSWIAIFSDRAVSTALEFGCEPDEFWPCRFQSNPEQKFFFHLPMKSFDIVDIEKSTFRQILPIDPPIPMFIEMLVTKELPKDLPPCFRADLPRTNLVFSELFACEDFKLSWDHKGFSGAKFRRLSE